ncbi:hypothetical protein [Nocardia gamkensis]|uniref:Uncharacterized protein n=1 Tax=Nocardia gamkensis TaxID=352869 RepID=A0A7X6LAS4_9NOCA|nr:hypothetical protein [Nocardia gamkensis]NKY30632.1 hypothetical protein [Nocardia gamkensis]NQE71068.1 hypothetical protein [Nocardia gamkensis]
MEHSDEWDTLVELISRNSYGVRVEPDSISLTVEDAEEDWAAPDVVIRRADDEWIHIERPFAKSDKVDLLAILTKVGSTGTIGGLVVVGEDILIRDTVLLTQALEPDDRFDNDVFMYEDPLGGIIDAARLLGRQLAGHDNDYD